MRLWFDSFLTPELNGSDWSTSRPRRLILREGTPSPHLRLIKSLMLDGWDMRETGSAYRILVAKTVGMVLVRRLSLTSEDSISVFSKLVWSVGLCPVGTGGWLLWFVFHQTRGFYDQLSIYKFLKKNIAPSSYLSLFLTLSLKEIIWKECESSCAAGTVAALWHMLPSKVLLSDFSCPWVARIVKW